ncbi:MAG: ABC transporter permease [Cellulomonas sp.]
MRAAGRWGPALEVEALKLRRATAARVAGTGVVVGVPAMAAGFVAVARSGSSGQLAVKVRPMLLGSGWEAYLGAIAQVLSIAVFLAVGLVVCWSFGREFTDGTFGALFALPTSLRSIAEAKLAVLTVWGLGVCATTLAVALPLGVVIGLGLPDGAALPAVLRVVTVGALTVALALPLALVASAGRGYLPGIGALLAIVIVTQIVTLSGAGGWFPYAAPGLWAGMGGEAYAAGVTALQLGLTLPVGALGAIATAWWWGRAEVI